jgi:heavy metal sensor kinase
MLTIRTKLIVAVVLVLTAVLVAFGTFIYFQVTEADMAILDARLESHADKLATEFEENRYEMNFPDVPALLEIRTEGLVHPMMRVVDSMGTVIYADSMLVPLPLHNWNDLVTRKEIYETILTGRASQRSLWIPVEIDDHFRHALQVTASLSDIETGHARLRLLFLLVIPCALVVTAVAIALIVRWAFRPMKDMIATAMTTSGSDLSKRVSLPNGRDEVHALGAALNTMMERIESAFRSQKQFTADASHEIRTPLTIIRSEAEFSLRRTRDKKTKESLTIVLSELDHLKSLTDDLLLIAKLESQQVSLLLQPVDLNALVKECVQRMKRSSGRRRMICQPERTHDVVVRADADHLRRVMFNLLDNAVRYSSPSSTIRVSIGNDEHNATVVVEDHGGGILPEAMPRIFERFHRGPEARSNHTGSGLGLAIVARIVELHGGRIAVQSTPGQGTTFSVALPLDPDH